MTNVMSGAKPRRGSLLCKRLAAVLCSLALGATAFARSSYDFLSVDGGLFLPGSSELVAAGTSVYVFDQRTLSEQGLLDRLNRDIALADAGTILGKADAAVNAEGKVDLCSISYGDEPVGTDWGVYMAVVPRDRGDIVFVSSVKEVSALQGFTYIAVMDSPSEASRAPLHRTVVFEGPGWYQLSSEESRIKPGENRLSARVVASSAEEAVNSVSVWSPDLATVGDLAYRKYFKLMARAAVQATGATAGERAYRVTAELDGSAIGLDESAKDLGRELPRIASGETEDVGVSAVPGLYYSVLASPSLDGTYAPGEQAFASGEQVKLKVSRPPEAKSAFFKVGASAAPRK